MVIENNEKNLLTKLELMMSSLLVLENLLLCGVRTLQV